MSSIVNSTLNQTYLGSFSMRKSKSMYKNLEMSVIIEEEKIKQHEKYIYVDKFENKKLQILKKD